MVSLIRLLALVVCIFTLLIPIAMAEPILEKARSGHHTEEGFRNFPIVEDNGNLGFKFYWQRFISSFVHPDVPESHVFSGSRSIELYETLRDENTITWIGQSTLLIKVNGVKILTDPYFSKLASPLIVGPERFVDPGIKAEALPKVDILLISHNHYDHLDEAFIEKLPNKEEVMVLVPLGLGEFFLSRGYSNIHELDWHASVTLGDLVFTSLPAVHYSGRGMGDKNRSLWCSWAISSPAGQYYFVGDSAYSPSLFTELIQGDR